MPKKENLAKAKSAKNDEFYTQLKDIEREMHAYLEFDQDTFRGKTVLLPCDDPGWSKFTMFFAQNFEYLGLKKLISTSYAPDSKDTPNWEGRLPLVYEDDPQFDKSKESSHGKIFVLTEDTNGDDRIDLRDLDWEYLEGDGDYRSEEVTKLRDEADIVVTNPPFSLFRDFVKWLMEGDVKFSILGNKNAVTYKEIFPLIKDNKIWSGRESWGGGMWFKTPDGEEFDKVIDGTNLKNVSSIWFTNMDHGRRHEEMILMNMADNIRYNKKVLKGDKPVYKKYDNYDAIEVSFTSAIPSDYDGVMGVPISFLDRYNPDQFEILGVTQSWDDKAGYKSKTYPQHIQVSKSGVRSNVTALNGGPSIKVDEIPDSTYYEFNGEIFIKIYSRILIRKRKP